MPDTTTPTDQTGYPNPLTVIFDEFTTKLLIDYGTQVAAPAFAKAFFDEYFARLNEVNAAQIALQTALSANSQVLSLQNQIQSLEDNNSLLQANIAQPTGATYTSTQIARNNFQIGLLQARLAAAQSAAQSV